MLSVETIKRLDRWAGGFLCRIASKKEQKPDRTSSILIIQLWGIGETILTLPAVHAVRKAFPKAQISILATERNRDVFQGNKDISEIKTIPLKPTGILRFIRKNKNAFDLAIDMEEYLNISALIAFYVGKERWGYGHGQRARLYTRRTVYNDRQHAAQTFLDLVSMDGEKNTVSELVELPVTEFAKQRVSFFLKESGVVESDNVVGITPGAAESSKCRMWPQENFAKMADGLIELYKVKVLFIGSANESPLIEDIRDQMQNKGQSINAAGKVSLSDLFTLVKRCRLFISNDTGPMHIAAAQKVPTIGLFGPNIPLRFGPYGKSNTSIYKGDNCTFSPCINVHLGRTPDCLFKKNSPDYQKCMKNISIADVGKAVEKIMQKS
ncbi:glycosyltransferase family 9 protein [Candidatus Woesearchaeota archaeon]|nr:glycosyltransferase family 9 protein [Candidatus Woesearchaeota archaeon]